MRVLPRSVVQGMPTDNSDCIFTASRFWTRIDYILRFPSDFTQKFRSFRDLGRHLGLCWIR